MDKREPSLVPEWLRSSGHGSSQLLSSASSHSDSSSVSNNSKNRTSRRTSDVRSPYLDRSFSTNTRRGSRNGFTRDAYSSFNYGRSNRDKERSRESRLSNMDPWDFDTPIPLGPFFIGREPELRRSYSMTTRKPGNQMAQDLTVGLKNGGSINLYNGRGTLPGSIPARSSRRTGFDKNFPSLRAEESNGGPDVVRVSSPGLCPAVQSLPVGNSALIAGEGWTSALAEAPNVIEKTGAGSHANVGNSATLMGSTSRNMAEALVQAPARTGTPPQGSVNTQRLEDRAIKQSRQLIPVVPSAPKGMGLNSFDKSKAKPVVRSGESGLASLRNTQQQSSMLLGNYQSNYGSQIKPDTTKKLVVLKPARENGVAAIKESGSPTAASQLTSTPSTQVTATNNPRDIKGGSVNMIAGRNAEKKHFLAQSQSRNAFYRALKQKTSTNISTDPSKTSSCILSFAEEKANSFKEPPATDSLSTQAAERDETMEMVEKVSQVTEKNNGFESAARPDEKEAEFLKSLGWDENNSEEEEAITEEEIRAFIEQCKERKPSLVQKLPIIQGVTKDATPAS